MLTPAGRQSTGGAGVSDKQFRVFLQIFVRVCRFRAGPFDE